MLTEDRLCAWRCFHRVRSSDHPYETLDTTLCSRRQCLWGNLLRKRHLAGDKQSISRRSLEALLGATCIVKVIEGWELRVLA